VSAIEMTLEEDRPNYLGLDLHEAEVAIENNVNVVSLNHTIDIVFFS
jgi:hypothetical protein